LYEAKDYAAALTILKQLKPFYTQTKDAGMTSLIGFAALETGENQLALDSFYQAAEWTDDEEYWLFLVDARIRLGQVEEAQKILDGLPQSKERDQRIDALLGLRAAKAFDSGQPALAEQMLLESKTPLSAGNLELLGWTQLRQDKLNAASASFEASYRKKPSSGAAQGLAFSHQRLKSTDKLIALADSLKGSLVDLSNDPAVREQIATGNLARISVNGQGQLVLDAASAYTPPSPGVTITVGPSYRHRNGDNGQGKLDVTGISVLGEWVGATDRVNVKLDQFIADNGATRQSSMNSPYALWRHRTDDDLELSLGLGISPTGGELPAKPIGEMGIASYAAKNGWNARLFRQSNLESILAMSGSYQANTPLGASATWGQVLEEGITLGGYVTLLEDWKTEGTLTAARITGVGVADNSKIAFWGRALRPISGLDGWRVGADMYTSSFDKNLSYYTPGFGGYYSPQFSLNLGPAVAYEQQLGQVKINAYASLGWGYVTQASADGNPLTGTDPGKYPSSSSSGLATHLDLDAQLPLGRNWTLGLNLGGLSSPGYEEWRARLYASHNF
jgi:tetratricopeptide (TPR) repeat protein